MTRVRERRRQRCLTCGLETDACLCAGLPRLRLATPVAVLQHVRERVKPTNTGRLLARMLEDSALLSFGQREPAFDPAPLRDRPVAWRLLFPRGDAPLLEPERPVGLVLLDGCWSRCRRASRHLPWVSELPAVSLPPGPPPVWTVRKQHLEGGLSTFEAALRALEVLEGSAAALPLRRAFARVTARQLYLKGRLPSPEIPAAWGL
jgi:DTW domain-containing protein YfiP